MTFPPGEFFSMQSISQLSSAPGWATQVGPAYNVMRSSGAPYLSCPSGGTIPADLPNRLYLPTIAVNATGPGSCVPVSLVFYYRGQDVLDGQEHLLRIYHQMDNGEWEPLETTLDTENNMASAQTRGTGEYALMTTYEFPLTTPDGGPGWAQFSYPSTTSQPVAEALESIKDVYTIVYNRDQANPAALWKAYDPDDNIPAWANTLQNMEFGKVYWIYLLHNTVLRMKGAPAGTSQQAATVPVEILPPAMYYGVADAAADSPVTAWVGNTLCGQSKVRQEGTQLVFAVSPRNSARYNLSPIDRDAEIRNARAWLGAIDSARLPARLPGERFPFATLDHLITVLQEEPADLLYLVCHGRMLRGEPRLVFEDDQGMAAIIEGQTLIERLDRLARRPRLVVLVSCESAGQGEDFVVSLGPRLVEHGIPAVIAMQGRVSFDTVARLMPVFFRELQRDGQVDRALSIARDAVLDRPDGWMPVLFMRLKNGRIWEDSTEPEPALDSAAIARLSVDAVQALVSAQPGGSSQPPQTNALLSLMQTVCAPKPAAREALEDFLTAPSDADAQAGLRSQLKKRMVDDHALARQVQTLLRQANPPGPTMQVSASNRGVAAGGNINGKVFTGDINGGVDIGGKKDR